MTALNAITTPPLYSIKSVIRLKNIKNVGSSEEVEIVVQIDTKHSAGVQEPRYPTIRYHVDYTGSFDVKEDLDELNMEYPSISVSPSATKGHTNASAVICPANTLMIASRSALKSSLVGLVPATKSGTLLRMSDIT